MRFSIYLFKDYYDDYSDYLRENYRTGEKQFEVLDKIMDLPYECEAYIQKNRSKPPKWLKHFENYFDFGEEMPENASNSLLLFLTVDDRVFGVCFGYAHNAIDRSKIEPRFGLKVSLNVLNAEKVKTIDTRRLDLITKQSKIHFNSAVPITDFGIDYSIDWLRFISGKPDSEEFATKVSGSDPLAINCESDLESLGEKCAELLEIYNSDQYKKMFPYIDSLLPVMDEDPIYSDLESLLLEKISKQEKEKITIAYPELFPDDIIEFKIFSGRRSECVEEVTLNKVYSFIQALEDKDDFLSRTKIIGLDQDGNVKTVAYELKDYIVAEVEYRNKIYILSFSQWFEADKDYVQVINDRLNEIEDITTALDLPQFIEDNETEYNQNVAITKGWLCLDRALFRIGGPYQRVEICDLVTERYHLIAIKKMSSSATLSHLFSQGSVSAQLYRAIPEYRERITTK